jgi:hypothetical protein
MRQLANCLIVPLARFARSNSVSLDTAASAKEVVVLSAFGVSAGIKISPSCPRMTQRQCGIID